MALTWMWLAACTGRGSTDSGVAPTALPIATAAPNAVGADYPPPGSVMATPPLRGQIHGGTKGPPPADPLDPGVPATPKGNNGTNL